MFSRCHMIPPDAFKSRWASTLELPLQGWVGHWEVNQPLFFGSNESSFYYSPTSYYHSVTTEARIHATVTRGPLGAPRLLVLYNPATQHICLFKSCIVTVV